MTPTPRRPALPPLSCLLPFALGLIVGLAQSPVDAAAAASASSPATTACSFGAFVQEDDRAGLDVRATPALSGTIVGTLPPTFAPPDNQRFHVRVEVDVSGSAGEWLRIGHARDNTMLTERAARPLFAGYGWVAGRKITVKSQAVQAHAAPDAGSPVVMHLQSGDAFDGDELVEAGHLVGCQGRWALVEYIEGALSTPARDDLSVAATARAGLPAGRFRAWVNELCGVQETTCAPAGR